MAGIGDSWGTKEELLHPRGPDGRWIRKGGIAKSIISAVLGFLANFRPRTFQNKNQSTQYLHNISRRQGKKRFGSADLRRLYDLPNVNEDLQDGVIDNPSTKQFVETMDRTETELPDDLILTTILPTEAFGFSAQTATGTNSDTDPGIRGLSGKLGADRGYLTMAIGNVNDVVPVPAGSVRLIVAAPKGTKVNIPGGSSSDPTLFLTRGQPLRITKVKPDGAGGWHMYATAADTRTPGEIPTPVGGPRGLQRPSTKERETAIRDLERIQATREGRPDEVAEQADIEARQRAAEANAQATPTPSPAQVAERRRVEALPQQPAPGEPPPRTEPAVGRVGEPGTPAAGGVQPQAPAPTVPEAPTVPRRSVDLRLAVRDAKIPSPSEGPRRKAFNQNYLGIVQGKKDPIDAIRDLDTDIAELRSGRELGRSQGSEEARESDADSLEALRNVIAKEYGLAEPETKRTAQGLPKIERPGKSPGTKLSKREQEAEERNRAAGEAEALPAPTPVKAAPRKAAKKATGTPVAKKAPAKKVAKKAAPEAPGDDLDKMTKAELLTEAERRDVTVPKSWTKDKIKAQLRDEEFRRPEKKTPAQRRQVQRTEQGLRREFEQREAQGEGAPAKDLDKMSKKELIAEAGRRGVTARDSWTKDRIKQAMLDREAAGAQAPEAPAPVKKAAKAAVPGAAPGTAAGKITAGRLQPGMRILVGQNNGHTTRKTGAKVATITSIDRFSHGGRTRSQTRIQINAVDEDGRPFIVGQGDAVMRTDRTGFSPSQTFMAAPEPGAAPAKKAAKAVPEGPSGHPGDTGMARALIPEERERQVKLDRVKAYGTIGTEVDELLANGASPRALAHRIRTRGKQQLIPDDDLKDMLEAAEAGDNDRVRKLARGLMEREGITQIGSTDDVVPLDRDNHQSLTQGGLPRDTSVVHVVRPGTRAKVDGDDVLIDRAVVEPANADEIREFEKSRRLVPEGSVTGTRTDTPVDNAPRKRELRQAWIAAEIQAPEGPVRTQTHEIRDKLLNGDITPEESIRMMESEIELNKEDLAELDAHLREADLTDAERREFQGRAAKLIQGIEAQEKASTFLRMYFKDEAPVVSLKEMKEVDPEGFEFLKDATPDDMREAAKEAGLDAPSGDNPDEMFRDLIKQVARNELARRAAKKAAKKAPAKVAKKAAPPAVPKERERIDARLVGAGLDFDENDKWVKKTLDQVQADLDGDEKTPAAIGRELDEAGTARMTTAVYEHGVWHAESRLLTPEEAAQRKAEHQAEYDRVKAEVTKIRELGQRLQKTRRKPAKKVAPATPEVAKLQDKVDDLEKRRIDDALGELTQSGDNRDRADAVLEGLTLPELRRLAEQSGIPTARTKRGLRDNILDRFTPRSQVDVNSLGDLPSREAAHELLAPLGKPELMRIARELSVPGASSKNMTQLRQEIVEATTGRRLDSIAIRGFEGASPERPDVPSPGRTIRGPSLGARVSKAGIDHPGRTFSDVDSAVGEADRMLQAGQSPTAVSRFLRERATRVSKADIVEEGRRFPTELDKDSLLSIRKANAEYLRRVATHVQQEAKGGAKSRPAKPEDLAPPVPSAPGAPSPSRTGTSPVGGTKSTAPEIPNNWGMLGTGGDVEFHDDGVIGQRLRQMGDDRLMDVDGEPLSNVIGKLATRAIRGEISQEQLLMDLDRLHKRLPAGSRAKGQVKLMMENLDAPARPMPDLPDGAPAPFRTAIEKLLQIPLARDAVDRPGFHRDRENSEVDKLLRLLEEFNEGRTGGLRFINDIMNMRTGLPHESQEGRFEIDRVLRDLHAELDRMYKNPELRPQLMPRERGTRAPKKATPRLTAIPGEGTGGRRGGSRPNLRVVRNENGEFTLVWDEGGDDHVQLPQREQHPSDVYAGSTV